MDGIGEIFVLIKDRVQHFHSWVGVESYLK